MKDVGEIDNRLDVVDFLYKEAEIRSKMTEYLKQIGDLERLISKVATGRINPREVVQLKRALMAIDPLLKISRESGNRALMSLGEGLDPCQQLSSKIELEINDDPPIQIVKGNVIAEGVSDELDELRKILYHGKEYLADLQERESLRTAIPSLKVGFNNVFGYYIEVRNTHKNKVPPEWIRKQTLVSAERYITEELKEYENKILGAEEKILTLESKLFAEIVGFILGYITPMQTNCSILLQLDCLLSFAGISVEFGYNRPEINDSKKLVIEEGRHPVIERRMENGECYVPNDIELANDDQQIIILTGPNMSGKSALLRQTALTVLMAQIGCFVPAKSASIGIVDKLFTRVGASDNISLGESTFMVEMNETPAYSTICPTEAFCYLMR